MIFGTVPVLIPAVPLGLQLHTFATFLSCITFACFAGCPACIAGPDLTPAMFLAEAAAVIADIICTEEVGDYAVGDDDSTIAIDGLVDDDCDANVATAPACV